MIVKKNCWTWINDFLLTLCGPELFSSVTFLSKTHYETFMVITQEGGLIGKKKKRSFVKDFIAVL